MFHHLRRPWAGRWGWVLAFPLAFASHYLLDAIPHFEDLGPLMRVQNRPWVFLGVGLIGGGISAYLYRRNRQASLLWLALSVWIALAGISEVLICLAAGLALLGTVAYRTRQADAVGYLLAGMLAEAADLIPRTWIGFHNQMHYEVDWGTALYLKFNPPPPPTQWLSRLQNPYLQLGYGLELLVEAVIFLAAFSVFCRLRLEPKTQTEPSEAAAAVAPREEAREPA
jgi:hypothetical protein